MSDTLLSLRVETLRLNPVAPFPSEYAHAKRMIKETRDGLVRRHSNVVPVAAVPANDLGWGR